MTAYANYNIFLKISIITKIMSFASLVSHGSWHYNFYDAFIRKENIMLLQYFVLKSFAQRSYFY